MIWHVVLDFVDIAFMFRFVQNNAWSCRLFDDLGKKQMLIGIEDTDHYTGIDCNEVASGHAFHIAVTCFMVLGFAVHCFSFPKTPLIAGKEDEDLEELKAQRLRLKRDAKVRRREEKLAEQERKKRKQSIKNVKMGQGRSSDAQSVGSSVAPGDMPRFDELEKHLKNFEKSLKFLSKPTKSYQFP